VADTPNRPDREDVVAIGRENVDQRVLRGSGWIAISFGGRQLLAFLTTLVLVRLLEPEAFGLVAIAWIVLAFIERVQESGISAALIYRRDDVRQAAASALVFAICAAAALYLVSFAIAPIAAWAFEAPDLTEVLRVLALVLVIRGFAVVPWSIIEREVDFRTRAKVELSAGVTQIAVAITLAMLDFGVWSLVFAYLASTLVECVLAWLLVSWRPSPRQASWPILRDMLRYGRFVGATNILGLVIHAIDDLLISRLLSVGSLGYFSVTNRLAGFPALVIGYIVGRVMFPVYSAFQGDVEMLRRLYVQQLQRLALFCLPLSVGLVVCAEPIVLVLFGDDWNGVVPVLRILAVYAQVRLFAASCNELWKGVGKPNLGLFFAAPEAVLRVPLLILLIPAYELEGAALALLSMIVLITAPALAVTFRLLDLTAPDVARALAPSALCSALLAGALALLLPLTDSFSPATALVLLVAAGFVVYVSATALFARNIVVPMWTSFRGIRA
jgi:O-antigen/teichoic acid export membrane protein